MTSGSNFFQARISAPLLQSAALAIALLLQVSPVHAETVTLVCQNENAATSRSWGSSFALRVDYDRKIVDLLRSDGTVLLSSAARITDSDVRWDADNSK